ncbi:MAG: hypothetical protein ACE5NP_00090 [Anaerolineae bacterium]
MDDLGGRLFITHRGALVISFLLAVLCWLGLWYLVTSTDPVLINRLLFLLLLSLAVLTTLTPAVYYLSLRFSAQEPYEGRLVRSLREASFLALFVAVCAWLRMIRVLNLVNGALLLGTLVLAETFILVRGIGTE